MPVINGVYTKDFPALGRAPVDTDIIPIAEVANQITYKTTLGEIFNAKVFGTTGRLSKFTGANTLGNSILNEIGNAIHLTNAGSSYASFGIINPGTPGEPGIDNDCFIGSTINNDFTIRVNNIEAARFDTALRFKIANIQNALADTDKFLVSDGGVVKYRTGTELRSDIGAGTGSVTSVGLTMPVAFEVANSPITSAGTLAVTAVGTASQYIRGDGQLATLPTGAGGGSAVNYYLNGSIASSVAGYQQMDNTAIIGAGTDFNLTGNGLIAQFLTDIDNPNRLLIPGGAWNLEMFFNISSVGGNAKFYAELLKYDGTTFTSIASGITTPEEITGGTSIDLYLTSLAVPETALLITDRLAIRVYIVDNSEGRTVTLHTEDNTLCQVTTTFAGGISALNGLTANTQYFAVGTGGTDFNISSILDTHTFNIPSASATARGVITTGTQTIAGAKTFSSDLTTKAISSIVSGDNVTSISAFTFSQAIAGSFRNTTISLPTLFVQQSGTANIAQFQSTTNDVRIKANGDIDGVTDLILSGSIKKSTFTYTLPSATGTLALTSDLSAYVTLATTQTITGEKTFTAGNIFIDSRSYFAEDNGQSGQAGYTQMITLADSFSFINGATTKSALFAYGGGVRSYILPSSNGTLALTSDLSGYLPLTGGTLTGALTLNSGVGSNPNFASTTNGLEITSDGSTASNRNIIFKIASTTALSIDNSTNVAIGYTTNPSLYKLDVNGTLRVAGAATFSSSVTGNGSGEGFLINQNGGSAGLATYSANTDRSQIAFKFAQNYPGSNNYTRVLDIVSTGDATGGGAIRLMTSLANSSPSTSMMVTPGGNVGIGTTTPSRKLDVNGSGIFRGDLTIFNSSRLFLNGTTGQDWALRTNSSTANFEIVDWGTEVTRVAITSGGNVRVNNSTDINGRAVLLQVAGGETAQFYGYGNGFGIGLFMCPNSAASGTHTAIAFRSPANGDVGAITTTSSATSYNTVSDYRLKQDLKEYSGIELISKIKTYDYEWKSDKSRSYGVLAHELQEVIPNAVTGEKDAEQMQGVDYSKLVPILVKAIQELKAEIDLLKNK